MLCGFVVHDPLTNLSLSVSRRNRVLALEIWCQGSRKPTSICICDVHGPREDIIKWHGFCSDFMDLVGSRKFRGPLVMAGDWNCDFGPTFSHYPGHASKNNDMRGRRELLESLCDANDLEFSFVDFISGLLRNHLHHAQCMQFPFTYVPSGRQHGSPSLLDFFVSSRGVIKECAGTWEGVPLDHAMVAAYITFKGSVKVYPRSTWVINDRDAAVLHLRQS